MVSNLMSSVYSLNVSYSLSFWTLLINFFKRNVMGFGGRGTTLGTIIQKWHQGESAGGSECIYRRDRAGTIRRFNVMYTYKSDNMCTQCRCLAPGSVFQFHKNISHQLPGRLRSEVQRR